MIKGIGRPRLDDPAILLDATTINSTPKNECAPISQMLNLYQPISIIITLHPNNVAIRQQVR